MIKTVVIAGICASIFAGALAGPLLGGSASEVAHAAVKELCFEHIGPQDKPMPAFCLIAPGAAPASGEKSYDSGDGEAIQLTSVEWRALMDLVDSHAQKTVARPAVLGDYQVRSIPSNTLVYLRPGAMRKIVAELEKGAGLNRTQSEMLHRLRLRLGVPSAEV